LSIFFEPATTHQRQIGFAVAVFGAAFACVVAATSRTIVLAGMLGIFALGVYSPSCRSPDTV
jgi:hypothetical protein